MPCAEGCGSHVVVDGHAHAEPVGELAAELQAFDAEVHSEIDAARSRVDQPGDADADRLEAVDGDPLAGTDRGDGGLSRLEHGRRTEAAGHADTLDRATLVVDRDGVDLRTADVEAHLHQAAPPTVTATGRQSISADWNHIHPRLVHTGLWAPRRPA